MTSNKISNNYSDCIFLITSSDKDNSNFGTCFCVHVEKQYAYFITCSHVIVDVGGFQKARIGGKKVKKIAYGNPDSLKDIAIVRTSGDTQEESLHVNEQGKYGDTIKIIGYKKFRKGNLKREIIGTLGKLIGFEGNSIGKGKVSTKGRDIRINDEYNIEKGYSGSPIIEMKSGTVIGILTHRLEDKTKGIAISVGTLNNIKWGKRFWGSKREDFVAM